MRAFTGTKEDQAAAVTRAVNHARAGDFIASGQCYHQGKGTMMGVMYWPHLPDLLHISQAAEDVHGIPETVIEMADEFFRGASIGKSKTAHLEWPPRFYLAIPPQADLTPVPNQFFAYALENHDWLYDLADERGQGYVTQTLAMVLMESAEARRTAAMDIIMHMEKNLNYSRDRRSLEPRCCVFNACMAICRAEFHHCHVAAAIRMTAMAMGGAKYPGAWGKGAGPGGDAMGDAYVILANKFIELIGDCRCQ